ncbi:universal stress protein [Halococcus sp. IIIV-5B]|uniref:universal stress protein n=1 Tax=Halococcus sp. IIIV-5B TaxID=2321230 RepID=UPI000E720CA5|nr:universal stress protein [Halococcus sp. IIIV-5B]RJT07176.1 universal stress protein [Halococcus sp. IIIV-5B]
MQRILANVDSEESSIELLSEVRNIASGTDVGVVLVSLLSPDNYENDQEVLAQIGEIEGASYESSPDGFAKEFASHLANEYLSAVNYEIVGEVLDPSDHADRIIEIAAEYSCDYIYITGKRRSPTGKALFGDRTQRVLLNFDGYVTVRME